MKRRIAVLLVIACATPMSAARATDVDGPNDCQRQIQDFGDAPEGIEAYPGVMGKFPTCTVPGPVGTLDLAPGCTTQIPLPGPAGFVRHLSVVGEPNYWLGCVAAAQLGVDSEIDGKVSAGGPTSACTPGLTVDCIETVGSLSFGQDECYGSNDAGIAALITFTPCTQATVSFTANNCGTGRSVFINICVDFNQDGDWNDVVKCGETCVPEWAVRNQVIDLPAGCATRTSPPFLVGPNSGKGWMRITISDGPVPLDFPWNGSASIAGQSLQNGETEDYPVAIGSPPPCNIGYSDFGDAPEGLAAYGSSGVTGHFPTCIAPNPAGLADILCPPGLGTPPTGPAGYVWHVQAASDPNAFWLGCSAANPLFVDSEPNGKFGLPNAPSYCDDITTPDCSSVVDGGLVLTQDECYGDNVDAAIGARVQFPACSSTQFQFNAYSCSQNQRDAFLNVLVDWNGDGDWNDDVQCPATPGGCTSEWAVKNFLMPLNPGCQVLQTPPIAAGFRIGAAWMRLTLTAIPVSDDFPWNGSLGNPNHNFTGGETEDYVTDIVLPSGGVGSDSRPAGGLWLALGSANPSASSAMLRFSLARGGRVSLTTFDAAGRRVRTLARGEFGAGEHSIAWDLRDERGGEVPAGVYLVKLEAEGRVLTQRLVRTR